jgi:small conductance mechanosensitive channel
MAEPLESLGEVQGKLIDLAGEFGPRLLAALVVLTIGYFANRWAGRWLDRALGRYHLEPPVRKLLVRACRGLVFGLFLIMELQNLGVELLPLIAGLGIAGAGIALAMLGVLGNVAAGLSIIFTKPYRVGEYISIAGEEGRVEDITLFNTTLSHVDRSQVVIPNRKIVGEILHNFGTIRQLDIPVSVAYGTDLETAISAIRGVLARNPRVIQDPAPVIQTALLADSGITIGVKPWVAVPDYGAARGEINQALEAALREKGIVIPFPQREIRLLEKG